MVSAAASKRMLSKERSFWKYGLSVSGMVKTTCLCGAFKSVFDIAKALSLEYFAPQVLQKRLLHVKGTRFCMWQSGHE